MTRVSYHELRSVLNNILLQTGFTVERADLCSKLFAGATCDGVSSHGLNRFPRFIEMIHRKVLENYVVQTYQLQPTAVKQGEEKVVRNGNKVDVYMTCIRSKFVPEQFEVHEGDEVHLRVTNVETVRNMTHGVAVSKYGINLGVDPGQTVETTFVADKVGTYWYYCTWFCSALHLEMRGCMLVKPEGVALNDSSGTVTHGDKAAGAAEKGSSYE